MDSAPQTPEAVRIIPSCPKSPEIIIKSQYVQGGGRSHIEIAEIKYLQCCSASLRPLENAKQQRAAYKKPSTSSPVSGPSQPPCLLNLLSPQKTISIILTHH